MAQIWLKRVLIPFWVLQLIFLALLLIAGGLALAVTRDIDWDSADDEYNFGAYKRIVDAGAGLLIALSSVSIIFDLVEILQLARDRLSPVLHLVFACIKTVFWVFYLILAIIGSVHGALLAIIIAIVLALTSLGQLIYGSVVMHRHRKGGVYRSANQEELGMEARGSRESDRMRHVHAHSLDNRPSPFRDPSPAASSTTRQSMRDTSTAYTPYRAY